MSQAPIPNQPYFNGIIYNPDFFATENGVSLDYATQNYLARAGTNPTSIATKTTFTGEVDANNISITTNGSFGGNVSTNSLSTSSDASIGGILKTTSGQASTNTTTGALQVAGGCGIGGSLNIGGSISVSGLSNYIQTYDSIYGYCRQTQGTAEFDYLTECNAYILNPYNKNPYNGTNVMAFGQNVGTASLAKFIFNGVSLQTPPTIGIGKPATTNAIDISGNGVISGNLTVNNSFTSNNLTTTGNAVVGGNLQVTRDSTMNGNLTVNNNLNSNLLTTTGDSSIGGVLTARSDFYVLGQSTFTTIYPNQIGVRNPTPVYDVDITGSGHLTGSLYVGSKLGVGTTNPTQNLHVVGSSYISNSLGIAKSNPSYTLDVSGIINTNNNLYVAGNIGIGKNNPSYPLDVSGNTNISGIVSITSTEPSFTQTSGALQVIGGVGIGGDINTGGSLFVNNTLAGANVGVNISNPNYPLDCIGSAHISQNLYVDASCGIGTKTPAYPLDVSGIINTNNNLYVRGNVGIGKNNPAYPLDVSGTVNLNSNIFLNNSLGSQSIYFLSSNSGISNNVIGRFFGSEPAMYFDYSSTFSCRYITRNGVLVNGNVLVLNSSGNIGIGRNNPSYLLDVNGIINTNNNLYVAGNIGVGRNNPSYSLDVSGIINTNSSLLVGGILNVNGLINTNNNLYVGGNIGIRTNVPEYSLDVIGDVQSYNLRLPNTGIIYGKNTSGTITQCFAPCWSDNITYLTYGSAGFNIRNNSFVNTMFFNNSNQVGIAKNNPAFALDVNGVINSNTRVQAPHYDVSYSSLPTLTNTSLGSTISYFNTLTTLTAGTAYTNPTVLTIPIGVYLVQAQLFTKTTTATTYTIQLGISTINYLVSGLIQGYNPTISTYMVSNGSQTTLYNYYLSTTVPISFYFIWTSSATVSASLINGNFIRIA